MRSVPRLLHEMRNSTTGFRQKITSFPEAQDPAGSSDGPRHGERGQVSGRVLLRVRRRLNACAVPELVPVRVLQVHQRADKCGPVLLIVLPNENALRSGLRARGLGRRHYHPRVSPPTAAAAAAAAAQGEVRPYNSDCECKERPCRGLDDEKDIVFGSRGCGECNWRGGRSRCW
jgi:hypothetical protein